MLCGMMIYVAYKGHKICEYPIGKVLFAFVPISLFILCGYDHVIANAAYFTFAGVWSNKLLWLLQTVTERVNYTLFNLHPKSFSASGIFKLQSYFIITNVN